MAARRGLGGSSSLSAGFKTLAVTKARGVSLIELNRPRKKNAFNVDMYHELQMALRDASEDPAVRVALLTGRGDYYSSGNDLSNFSQLMHPLTMARQSKEKCIAFVDAFIDMKKPLVCAVNGPAIGIAVTTLGLCDVVLASSTATFRTPFAELHQSPEGPYTLPLHSSLFVQAARHSPFLVSWARRWQTRCFGEESSCRPMRHPSIASCMRSTLRKTCSPLQYCDVSSSPPCPQTHRSCSGRW